MTAQARTDPPAERSDAPLGRGELARLRGFGALVALGGGVLLLAVPLLDEATLRARFWAFDHLIDTPLALRAALAALVAAAALPRVQRAVEPILRSAGSRLAAGPGWAALLALALFATLWLARQHNFVLGDSALLMQFLTQDVHAEGFHVAYDEPLDLYLHSVTYGLLHRTLGAGAEHAYALWSCAAGVVYAAVMVGWWRRREPDPLRAACALLLVASTASVQLFFGYVENYTLVAVGCVFYAVLASEALRGRGGLLAPAVVLGISISLHLLAGWLLPSLLYVWWCRYRASGGIPALRALCGVGAGVVLPVAATVLYLTWVGVPPASMSDTHIAHLKFIFLTDPDGPHFRYAAYSAPHLRDLANEWALVSLPGVLVLGGMLAVARRHVDLRDPTLRVLAICAVSFHAFAAAWNPEISAYRDWDLFAITGIFDALLGAWVVARFAPSAMATVGVTLPVAVLALGLTASFVASNATRSLEVPVYHDRAHVRAGHLLRETGHVDRAFAEYEEALQIEPRNADALYELGTRAWNDRDLATAEPLLRRFLEAEASGERADQVGAVLRDVDAQRSRK